MKKQAYQKPTIYNSDGTKAQTGTFDIRTDPLTNSTADGILDYYNNNLEALKAQADNGDTTDSNLRYDVDKKVNRSGDAMTGPLKINTGGSIPLNILTSGTTYKDIQIESSDGNHRIATIRALKTSEGRCEITIGVSTTSNAAPTGITISRSTTDIYATAPTPDATDNSKKIATTEFVNAKAGNYLPLSGGTMTGNNAKITMSNGESYIVSYGNGLYLGGTDGSNGSNAAFFTNTNGNGFQLNAGDGTTSKRMIGKPDGTLTWNGNNILTAANYNSYALPLSGGTVKGTLTIGTDAKSRGVLAQNGTNCFRIAGGEYSYNDSGAFIHLYSQTADNNAGNFQITAHNSSNEKALVGKPDGTLTWGNKKITVNSNTEDVTITANSTTVASTGNYNNAYRCGCVVTLGINVQIKAGLASGTVLFTGLLRPKKSIGACLGTGSDALRVYIDTSGNLKLDQAGPSSNTWCNGCITYITID